MKVKTIGELGMWLAARPGVRLVTGRSDGQWYAAIEEAGRVVIWEQAPLGSASPSLPDTIADACARYEVVEEFRRNGGGR